MDNSRPEAAGSSSRVATTSSSLESVANVAAAGSANDGSASSSSSVRTNFAREANVSSNNVAFSNVEAASTETTPRSSDAAQSSDNAEGNDWLSYADLINESYPVKSRLVYLKAFKLFEKFLKSKNQWEENVVPSELAVLNYFYHLRNDLKWAPTTLWTTYARINAVMIRVYGTSLKTYARVASVLKSYDSGHSVKQASIFTPQQIEDFLTDPELSSKYWLVRKVVALTGYFGGFRNIELKSLKFENVECDEMGYWFSFERSKQRGRLEQSAICVPRRQPDWIPVASDSSRTALDFDPASVIDLYLAECQADFCCTREELKGDFFRATHGENGQKFTKLTLGKNTIGRVGVQVASELCLANPESFTGHCWRRSCGTSASDSGVNVTTLMSMMGWSSPKTAMVYVKKSRTTSLQMSLYLANVQRQNCSKPFPSSPLEMRQVVRESQVRSKGTLPQSVTSKISRLASGDQKKSGSKSSCPLGVSSKKKSASDVAVLPEVVKTEDDSFSTQELVRDVENECIEERSSSSDVQSNQVEKAGVSGCSTLHADAQNDEGKIVDGGSLVGNSVSGVVASLDPQMATILQNLNNTGNLTIHFHFDRSKTE